MKGDIPSTADYHAAVERIRDLGEQNVALQADLAATRDKLRQAEAAAQAEAFYQCESELEQAQARIAALEAQIADGMKDLAAGVLGRAERAEARIAALEQAIRVIRKCVTDAKDGEFWTARKWLDTRKVYHDDLSGLRVVEAVCQEALKAQADARGREEER